MHKNTLRGELSGPILAILITAFIVVLGTGLTAVYFMWLAPNASKTPTVSIVGAPALQVSSQTDPTTGATTYSITAFVTIKNDGTDAISVQSLVIKDDNGAQYKLQPVGGTPVSINAGEKLQVTFEVTGLDAQPAFGNPSYEAVILTDGGVIPISVFVIE